MKSHLQLSIGSARSVCRMMISHSTLVLVFLLCLLAHSSNAKNIAKRGENFKGNRPKVDCPPCDTGSEDQASWTIDETETEQPEEGSNTDPWATEEESTEPEPWDTTYWGGIDGEDPEETPVENGSIKGPEETTSRPHCTCMSIIECGAKWRISDLEEESEESLCAREGEVCCEIQDGGSSESSSEGDVAESTEGPEFNLQCGEAIPVPNVVPSQPLTDDHAKFAEFPWTVILLQTDVDLDNNGIGDYRCAGSLIHPRIVVTAAHCLIQISAHALLVRAGEWDLEPNSAQEPKPHQDRGVQDVIIHPKFREGHPPYDFALIVVNEPFILTDNVNTICLPVNPKEDFDHSNCYATGWGLSPKGIMQKVMKRIFLPIMPRKECQAALRTTRLGKYFKLDKSFVCAGGEAGKDVCTGDGGGPLACVKKDSNSMLLVGVTSWGIDCGKPGIPGVFTDVAHISDWVHDALNKVVG